MAYQGKKFGSGKSFGGKPKFGGSRGGFEKKSFGKPAGKSFGKTSFELFDVTCDRCGKATQIPFKPSGTKPVYCRDCFSKGDEPPRKTFSPRSSGSDDLSEINEKLDKIMRALKIN